MINPRDQYEANKQAQHQPASFWHTQQLWQQHQDMSIYSPSFPYHIYDSINLPGEQQQQHHHHQQQQQQHHQPYTYGRTSAATTPNNNNYNYLSHTLNLSHHNQNHNTASTLCRKTSSSCNTSKTYSNFRRNTRQFFYEYRTILEYSAALILIALTLLTIIKFTLFTSSQTPYTSPYAKTLAPQPPIPSGTLLDEFPTYPEIPFRDHLPSSNRLPSRDSEIDTLKSKLIIGEFVILNQNYSHVDSQRALLAERIVKLMDQWILASDFRPNYSKMEVTRIRPNRPSGIIVECNIILNESIGFAAPLFGAALYNSLVRSNDRLANMPNYIIDKNSIKFSTVPDKDIRAGIVPPSLIPASVGKGLFPQPAERFSELPEEELVPSVPKMSNQESAYEQATSNLVVWSAWSDWSSCTDKNGFCDPQRLHSRIRNCIDQTKGDKVDNGLCKQRFNPTDLDLEVELCARLCQQQQPQPADRQFLSDAPSAAGPHTAPSIMLEPFLLSTPSGPNAASKAPMASGLLKEPLADPSTQASAPMSSSSEHEPANGGTSENPPPLQEIVKMPTIVENQVSCSNCTSDEICLLLISQKVPFCAKMKDRIDESGCGGWCKGPNQICQPVGANAFKCIHDSECLPDEWRCHDSQCIPLSKRCDGHSNCYDNSDERDCPP